MLCAKRTLGGQRTYLLTEIERLRDGDGAEVQNHAGDAFASPAAPAEPSTVPIPAAVAVDVPPWKVREANASADLAVTRLKIERREEVRRYRAEEQARLATARAEAEARAAQSRLDAQREADRRSQQQALESAKQMARIRIVAEPAEVRAEVERFLATNAESDASPEWIQAEVIAILDRRRAERAFAQQQERETQKQRLAELTRTLSENAQRTLLLSQGSTLARLLTADRSVWDADAASEAIEDVREHLAHVVKPDWSHRRVEREVQDVLADWD